MSSGLSPVLVVATTASMATGLQASIHSFPSSSIFNPATEHRHWRSRFRITPAVHDEKLSPDIGSQWHHLLPRVAALPGPNPTWADTVQAHSKEMQVKRNALRQL